MKSKSFLGVVTQTTPFAIEPLKDEINHAICINNFSSSYLEVSKGVLTLRQTERMTNAILKELIEFTPGLPDAKVTHSVSSEGGKSRTFLNLHNFFIVDLFDKLIPRIKALGYDVIIKPMPEVTQDEI